MAIDAYLGFKSDPKPPAPKEVVGTPEGDNEFAPDQPLKPAVDGVQVPRGSEPDPYKED